jgi:undecaprenyl pyrophosphate phosphatase UppP
MVVGLAALWWLVRWIRAGRLASFAWYLVPLGAVVVVWQLLA